MVSVGYWYKDNGKGLNCSVDDYIFDKNFSI